MKRRVLFALPVLLLAMSCTSYSPMGFTGGYDDYPLGAGKYKVISRGNGFTSEQRVRSIAFLHAAELTLSLGKHYFYILDDQGQTTNDLMITSDRYGLHSYNVRKHGMEVIIMPTDNEDGINAEETAARYRAELGLTGESQ